MAKGKYKIAYAYLSGLLNVNESDAKILTHINIAFGLIDSKGLLCTDALRHMDRIRQIKEWNHDIKIVLSIGGWGADGFSQMSSGEEGRKAFAKSCADYVKLHNLDGIDIDWEYPGIDWGGITTTPSDKENYTKLLMALREALGEDKILSVAVGAGDFFIANSEMEKVAQICDYVQLMTYDMRAEGCYTAGHHTALYSSECISEGKSVHDNVQRFIKAGVPAEKIVIGAAFYSRIWRGVENNNNGLFMPAKEEGVYGFAYTQLVSEYIDKNGFVKYWDEKAKAPYLFNGSDFVSYDDPKSIAEKCKYVNKNGLLGIMYWEHGLDETHVLIESIDMV